MGRHLTLAPHFIIVFYFVINIRFFSADKQSGTRDSVPYKLLIGIVVGGDVPAPRNILEYVNLVFVWHFIQLRLCKHRPIQTNIIGTDIASAAFANTAFHTQFQCSNDVFVFETQFT